MTHLALYSNHVAFPKYSLLSQPSTIPAAILIQDQFIQAVLPITPQNPVKPNQIQLWISQYPNFQWQNLGDQIISPGIIDINACFNHQFSISDPEWEGYTTGTYWAISGGVTTVVQSPDLVAQALDTPSFFLHKVHTLQSTPIFCDIALLGFVCPQNLHILPQILDSGVVGVKAYLIPPAKDMGFFTTQNLDILFSQIQHTGFPLVFHPEVTNQRYLFMSSPFRNECLQDRRNIPDPPQINFAAAFPQDISPSSADKTPNSTPITDNKGSKLSSDETLRKLFKHLTTNHQSLIKAEYESYGGSGQTIFVPQIPKKEALSVMKIVGIDANNPFSPNRSKSPRPAPLTIQKPRIKKQNNQYKLVLANSAVHWEVNGIKMLVNQLKSHPGVRLHLTGLGSGTGTYQVQLAKEKNPDLNISCDTAGFYLKFSEQDIREGDTRFKATPPIREETNKLFLIQTVRKGLVDSIASFHNPVKPQFKCMDTGDFKRAVSGIHGIKFSLQTALSSFQVHWSVGAVYLAKLLSETPAAIMGLQSKGTIEPGKHADLVIWDPFEMEMTGNYPEVSPFKEQALTGKVVRTYLRGALVYQQENSVARGALIHFKC